jgi:hypothetical protein
MPVRLTISDTDGPFSKPRFTFMKLPSFTPLGRLICFTLDLASNCPALVSSNIISLSYSAWEEKIQIGTFEKSKEESGREEQ